MVYKNHRSIFGIKQYYMSKLKLRFCEYCQNVMPDHRNMNSKFCSTACYDANKADIAAESYKKRAQELVVLNNDEILQQLYPIYMDKMYVCAAELNKLGFNWAIYTQDILVNNTKSKALLRYGYTLFDNQMVKIWKLSTR
jgi:hypothetical protein